MDTFKLVLTSKEVCEALGISRSSFAKLRKLGVFKPCFGLRRNEKYSRQSVMNWVNGETPKQEK